MDVSSTVTSNCSDANVELDNETLDDNYAAMMTNPFVMHVLPDLLSRDDAEMKILHAMPSHANNYANHQPQQHFDNAPNVLITATLYSPQPKYFVVE